MNSENEKTFALATEYISVATQHFDFDFDFVPVASEKFASPGSAPLNSINFFKVPPRGSRVVSVTPRYSIAAEIPFRAGSASIRSGSPLPGLFLVSGTSARKSPTD